MDKASLLSIHDIERSTLPRKTQNPNVIGRNYLAQGKKLARKSASVRNSNNEQ